MDQDYNNRGYLLPEGCKDLIDILKPKSRSDQVLCPALCPVVSVTLPPDAGELVIPERMTVRALANLLNRKPSEIVADLIELKVMASLDQMVSFGVVSQVLLKYGFKARRDS
jgi:hypothetical protein